jgi:uncharacterized protein with PIN domain
MKPATRSKTMTGPLFGLRRTVLRETKRCAECGTGLAKGSAALYHPITNTVSCSECPTPLRRAHSDGFAG